MSNAFAIAGVTAALKSVLARALVSARSGGILSANADVSSQPPDRISTNGQAESRLNLFLYQATPNAAFGGGRHPVRGDSGERLSNSWLALDLLYVLSAFGVDELEAEVLLGHGMQAFHETPGLSRAALRVVFDPGPPDGPGLLPRAFRRQAIHLADQIETIKLSPRPVSSDEMSKLWSNTQSHYRASAVYVATVVLIESSSTTRAAPPVLMRGPMDRGPAVQPSLEPPFPTLLAVVPQDNQPAARPDSHVEIFGRQLAGDSLVVRFRHATLDLEMRAAGGALTVAATGATGPAHDAARGRANAVVRVDLAQAVPAGGWAAGSYATYVEVASAEDAAPHRSNVMTLDIAPAYAVSGPDGPVVTRGPNDTVKIGVVVSPSIRPGQACSLILGDRNLPGSAVTSTASRLEFQGRLPSAMFTSGARHLARLRVDGVESLCVRRASEASPLEFDPEQRITMP